MFGFVVVDDGIIADIGYGFVFLVDGGVLGVDISKVGAVVGVDVAGPGVVVNSNVGLTGGIIRDIIWNNIKNNRVKIKGICGIITR